MTLSTPQELYPVYKQERSRILSNAACDLRCARQYGPASHDGGAYFLAGRKGAQTQLANLRRNWALVRAAVSQ